MELIYPELLPNRIPVEIQKLIHMFAGTCTPSCKHIKLYVDYVKSNKFRYYTTNTTLWASGVARNTPRFLMRCYENKKLNNQELDLKIAWYVLKREEYSSYDCDKESYEYISTIEWYQIHIDQINEELKERIHFSDFQKVKSKK